MLNLDTQLSDLELVERLIREYKVAALPATTFGVKQRCQLRVAYGALQKDTATEGIGRLIHGLKGILDDP